ncbi:MAG: DUF3833 family protein [Pseudomonadota bacterium]
MVRQTNTSDPRIGLLRNQYDETDWFFPMNDQKFILEDYFDGDIAAWGVFRARFGDKKRSFRMDIEGARDGSILTLDERVLYDDGERGDRFWTFTRKSDTLYEGVTEDVPGVSRGVVLGDEIRWSYDFRLKVGERGVPFEFDDRMYLMDNETVLNRVVIKKFGVRVGDITASFHRDAAVARSALAEVA